MARDRELLAEVAKSRTTAEELQRQLTASEETLAATRSSLRNTAEMLEASEARVLDVELTARELKEVVSDNNVSCVSISPRLRKPLLAERIWSACFSQWTCEDIFPCCPTHAVACRENVP